MKTLLTIGLVAVLASPPAFADCVAPPPIGNLPNGATASRDEMLAAMHTVKTYNAEVTAYSECMIKASGDDRQRNAVVDTLRSIADKFNAELRIFKARNGA